MIQIWSILFILIMHQIDYGEFCQRYSDYPYSYNFGRFVPAEYYNERYPNDLRVDNRYPFSPINQQVVGVVRSTDPPELGGGPRISYLIAGGQTRSPVSNQLIAVMSLVTVLPVVRSF